MYFFIPVLLNTLVLRSLQKNISLFPTGFYEEIAKYNLFKRYFTNSFDVIRALKISDRFSD